MASHAIIELLQMAPAAASLVITQNTSIIASTIGGLIIGGTAAAYLRATGRITGISGILHRGIVSPHAATEGVDDKDSSPAWRRAFMGGLLGAGAAAGAIAPEQVFGPMANFHITEAGLVVGGALVGVGTRLGNGCTSGHGVCGLARLSPRSAAAVGTFMATGFASAWGAQHIDALRPLLRGETAAAEPSEEAQAVQALLAEAAGAAGAGPSEVELAVAAGLQESVTYSPSLAQVPLGVAAPAAVGAISALLAFLSHRDSRRLLMTRGVSSGGSSATRAAGDGEERGTYEYEGDVRDNASFRSEWLRRRAFADTAVSYGLGLSFGAGLIVSGMADPMKVIGFLDLQHPSGWDPSLAFVMGGAAGVGLPVFQGVLKQQREWRERVGLLQVDGEGREGAGPSEGEGGASGTAAAAYYEQLDGVVPHPWLRPAYYMPTATHLDGKLLGGAALFGLGWGLSGVCPGPGLMALASGSAGFWLWASAMLAGQKAVDIARL